MEAVHFYTSLLKNSEVKKFCITLMTELTSTHKGQNAKAEDSPEILNLVRTAQLLHLAKQTVYGFTAGRKIPHYKTGKRIFFQRSKFMDWVLKTRIKTEEEIEMEASSVSQVRRNNITRKH